MKKVDVLKQYLKKYPASITKMCNMINEPKMGDQV